MKVYGVAWMDGDERGLAIWEGANLYGDFQKAKAEFATLLKVRGKHSGELVNEDGTKLYYHNEVIAAVVEFEVK